MCFVCLKCIMKLNRLSVYSLTITIIHHTPSECTNVPPRALQVTRKVDILTPLGALYYNTGRYEEALQVYREAAGLKPDSTDIWLALVRAKHAHHNHTHPFSTGKSWLLKPYFHTNCNRNGFNLICFINMLVTTYQKS